MLWRLRYTEELDAFGQATDLVFSLEDILSEEQQVRKAVRYRFRKELRLQGTKRLEWIKAILAAPWHEYDMGAYTSKLPKYNENAS